MFANAIVSNLLRTAALLTTGLLVGCSDAQSNPEHADRIKLSDGSTVVVRKAGDKLRWTRGTESGEMLIYSTDHERNYSFSPHAEDTGMWVRFKLDKPGPSGHIEGIWSQDTFAGEKTLGTAILEVNELP
jgi:hypothetical protein